ncbi:MAG: NAD(P)-dependent oxidoreductase, partial [Acidobacteria bacterium]|nr:NAD(P)-dependent oxidoreductase [Acidobacteriota bacterium]
RDPAVQVLVLRHPRGTEAPVRGAREGRAEALEAVADRSSVARQVGRVHGRQGGDVLLYGHRRRALDDSQVRRQEARPPELHAALPRGAALYEQGRPRRGPGRPADRRQRRHDRGRRSRRRQVGRAVLCCARMDERTVGFIGLGRMGSGMARNLLKAGVPLVVWDVLPEAARSLSEDGASVAADPAALAASAELIFLCVPSDKEAGEVLFGERGVARGGNTPAVVDTTTMNHRAARRLAERARDAGLSYADCPVSGMPLRAEKGTLTMMFGGSAELFALSKPCLAVMGEFVVHCGDVGMGQLMKAVNNIVYDVNIAAFCEVLPFAVKAGLQPAQVAEVLTTGNSRSFASGHFVPRIMERRFEGDFSLRAAYKDIVNIQEAAAQLDASLPLVEAMVKAYRAAIEMGFGDEPKSAMVKVYEERMGQEVRIDPRSA